MRCKPQRIFLILLFGLVITTPSWADDAALAQDILSRLQQLSESYTLSVRDGEQAVQDYERKLFGAKADVSTVRKELVAKRQTLQQILTVEPVNVRQQKLAEHGVAMAERGIKNRLKRVRRIEGKLQQALLRLEQARIQLTQNSRNVAAQKAKLKRLRAAQKIQSKSLAAASSAVTAKPAGAKSEGLSLIPTRASRDSATTSLAPSEPAEMQPALVEQAADAGSAVPVPQLTGNTNDDAVPTSGATEVAAAEQQLNTLNELARQQAELEQQRLQQALSAPRSGRQRYGQLDIRSENVSAPFKYLGNQQYRAEVAFKAGHHRFTVGSHHYRGTIPSSDDGQVYVFLYDTRRKGKPRLSMYRKSLLN